MTYSPRGTPAVPASEDRLVGSSPAALRLRRLVHQARGSFAPLDRPGASGFRLQARGVSLAMANDILTAFAAASSEPPQGHTGMPAPRASADTPRVSDAASWGLWSIAHRTTFHVPDLAPQPGPLVRQSAELRVPWPIDSTTGTLAAPDAARLEGAGDLVVAYRQPNTAGRMGIAALAVAAAAIAAAARRRARSRPVSVGLANQSTNGAYAWKKRRRVIGRRAEL